jgi:hypothetical protein
MICLLTKLMIVNWLLMAGEYTPKDTPLMCIRILLLKLCVNGTEVRVDTGMRSAQAVLMRLAGYLREITIAAANQLAR